MPRRDGTGPEGMGVMTGRGTGFCSGYALSGDAGWLGYGCRRGFRGMAFPRWSQNGLAGNILTKQQEKELLSKKAEILDAQLEQIKKRIQNLEEDR
ncbi:MAG: DUF5320 domain-containing protein [Clostridiales bacterium]|nr:DUF5320 domain-containing protein [Clostridiales bacterium]